MIRTQETQAAEALLKETANALNGNTQGVDQYAILTPGVKADQMKLLEEIQALERKVEEVNEILCKATLSYMIRFQLKDDLEYYHEIIRKKKQQLASY